MKKIAVAILPVFCGAVWLRAQDSTDENVLLRKGIAHPSVITALAGTKVQLFAFPIFF
jgi:hypothetical protein